MRKIRKIHKILRWHVCRVNFARKIFFRATNFLTKNAPKISPKFSRLCSVGQKKSRKIPSKFPTKFSKFPCEKSQKIHRQASAGAQGEQNPRAHKNKIGTSTPPPFRKSQHPPKVQTFMGIGVFQQKEPQKCQAPIKLAQPFPAPELRAEKLRTRGLF